MDQIYTTWYMNGPLMIMIFQRGGGRRAKWLQYYMGGERGGALLITYKRGDREKWLRNSWVIMILSSLKKFTLKL